MSEPLRTRAVFVTGTDTGCGKTTAAAAIACAARGEGLRVRVLKPIETGCEQRDGVLVPADARALARAAHDERADTLLCPYRLALPAAPAVAARAEGVEIELHLLRTAFRDAAHDADLVLVEGAGGLLVPITAGLDMAGLAQELGLPLLVVARAALGTINHTRLTLAVAQLRGLRVAAIAINDAEPDPSPADRANLAWLLEELRVPVRFSLAHERARDAHERALRQAASVPLTQLLAALD